MTIGATDLAPLVSGYFDHYVNGVLVEERVIDDVLADRTDLLGKETLHLEEGTNIFDFVVNDSAGNKATFTITVVYDSIPPAISITSPSQGAWFNTTSLNVTWTASDGGSGIAYYIVGLNGQIVANTTNEYCMITGLSAGQFTVDVMAFDRAGNSHEDSKSFNIELSSPSVAITSPSNDALLDTSNVLFTWTNSSASGISEVRAYVDGQRIDETGSSSFMKVLSDGTHTLEIQVEDNAGNWNETSVSFVVDATAPSITILTPTGGSYNNTGMVDLSWSASDATSGVAYYEVDAVQRCVDQLHRHIRDRLAFGPGGWCMLGRCQSVR